MKAATNLIFSRTVISICITLAITACGSSSSQDSAQISSSVEQPAVMASADEPLNLASVADASVSGLLKREKIENEFCRGGIDEQETAKACARRNHLVKQLAVAGWCYGEGAIDGAHSEWARCQGQIDTSPLPETASPKLAAYQKRISQSLTDHANAQVLFECGWRSAEWFRKIEVVLNAQRRNDDARPPLTPDDENQMARWQKQTELGYRHFAFGTTHQENCRRLTPMPWQDRVDAIAERAPLVG